MPCKDLNTLVKDVGGHCGSALTCLHLAFEVVFLSVQSEVDFHVDNASRIVGNRSQVAFFIPRVALHPEVVLVIGE